MRLPDHLLRTYRQYKEAEQHLLTWIHITAPATSIPTNDGKENQKPVKLKGRARTKARRAAAAKSEAKPLPTHFQPAKISLFDIIPPIEAIAKDPATKIIPSEIVATFKIVLELRQRCIAWFKSNTNQHDTKTIEANERHLYPVWILQKAFSVLKAKIVTEEESEPFKTTESVEPDAPNRSSNNAFDLLDVEDTVDELYDSLPSVRSDLQSPSWITKEERAQDDFDLAMYCLHADVQEVEDFLVLELVRYSIDQQNADTLSFLISTAVDQVWRMQEEIDRLVESPDAAHEELQKSYYENNKIIRAVPPLTRMQHGVALQMQRWQGLCQQRFQVPHVLFPKPEDSLIYLEGTVEDRWRFEEMFLQESWSENTPQDQANFLSLVLDSMLKCVRELKSDSGHWDHGINPCLIPLGHAFAIRVSMLARIVFGTRTMPAYDQLIETLNQSARSMDAWQITGASLAQSVSIESLNRSIRNLSYNMAKPSHLVQSRLMSCLQDSPSLCCLNDLTIKCTTSVASIQVLDESRIFTALAHLWNLLQEFGYLSRTWPDLQALINLFGEKVAFQGARPNLVFQNKSILWNRFWHALGVKQCDIPVFVDHLERQARLPMQHTHAVRLYTSADHPLLHILDERQMRYSHGSALGAEDALLIAYATVIVPMLGKKTTDIQFGRNGDRMVSIDNKHELWKLYDRGPGLSGIEQLFAIKKGLNKELAVHSFAYLPFLQACAGLVDTILVDLANLEGTFLNDYKLEDTFYKVKYISYELLMNDDPTRWRLVASKFDDWLKVFGGVGKIADTHTSTAQFYPLPLRPDVVQLVREIVGRRGLAEGIFTREQEYGLGVSATYSWEEKIRSKAARGL